MPGTPLDRLTMKYVKALWRERDRITDMIAAVTRKPNGAQKGPPRRSRKLKAVKRG